MLTSPTQRTCVPVLLALLLLAPSLAAAQQGRNVVGGQVGYARSWVTTNDPALNAASSERQGAFVGLFYRGRINSWIAVQPEMDLTVKGGSFPVLDPNITNTSLEFGYLEIPLIIRIGPNSKPNSVRPVIFGGASAGFDVGCTVVATTPVDSLVLGACPDGIRSVEWSWLVGGGIQWNLKGVSLGLEGRYMNAITTFTTSPLQPKNRLLALLLVLTI